MNIEAAEAIAAELAAGTWSIDFEPVLSWAVRREVADLVDLAVSVVPISDVRDLKNRDEFKFDWVVDVGVQKQIATFAEGKALADLADEFAFYFAKRRIGTAATPNERIVCLVPEIVNVQETFDRFGVATFVVRIPCLRN